MKPVTLTAAAVLVGFLVAIPMSAHSTAAASSLTTVIGTVMCRDSHQPSRFSTVCREGREGSSHYVLVTDTTAYDIKHQNFSGLHQLVGTAVKVVGELDGHVLDILQMQEVDLPNPQLP